MAVPPLAAAQRPALGGPALMAACQPVEVSWHLVDPGSVWEHWMLEALCRGCQQVRTLFVSGGMAEIVEMAEKTEQVLLKALHAP